MRSTKNPKTCKNILTYNSRCARSQSQPSSEFIKSIREISID